MTCPICRERQLGRRALMCAPCGRHYDRTAHDTGDVFTALTWVAARSAWFERRRGARLLRDALAENRRVRTLLDRAYGTYLERWGEGDDGTELGKVCLLLGAALKKSHLISRAERMFQQAQKKQAAFAAMPKSEKLARTTAFIKALEKRP
jgi:hypothetical protein